MKNEKNQSRFGQWVEHTGQLILFLVCLACAFDVYGFETRGHLLVPLNGYFTVIASGIALIVVAAPIKHALSFRGPKKVGIPTPEQSKS